VAEFVQVARVEEIPLGSGRRVRCKGHDVAVFHTPDGFLAFDDACSHRGESLAAGEIEDGVLTCKFHGARFDVASGGCLTRPGPGDVGVHEVRVVDEHVEVRLGEILSVPPTDDDWFDYA
jgi:nitrite reductase/ring-hydroxylating ferredoxin subunit